MDEKQKEDVISKTETNASLNETDLESVSGGRFTIIDTCQNRWVQDICREAMWGFCPNLSMKRAGERIGNSSVVYDLVSCDKGCFKDVKYYGKY